MNSFTKVKFIYVILAFIFTFCAVTGCSPAGDDQVVVITDSGSLSDGVEDKRPTVAPTGIPEKATIEPQQTSEPTETPAPTQSTSSNIDPDKPMVALTFDDGPHAPVTSRILDMVEQYNIKVTFFMVGNRIAGNNIDVVKRAYALGCELANHSWDHTSLKGMNRDQLKAILDPVDDAVYDCVGVRTKLVRPVGGAYDDKLLKIAEQPYIMWSVDTEDWRVREKNAIFEHVKNDTFDGAIILMHDIRVPTADACELAIPWLIEQGYQLVTVSELFEARGITLEPGQVYFKAKPTAAPTPEATNAPTTSAPAETPEG